MSSSKLIRLGGLASVLGGLLWILIWYMRLFLDPSDRAVRRLHEGQYEYLIFIPSILFMAGLAAVHVLQAQRSRQLGKRGLILLLVALALMAVGVVVESGIFAIGILLLIIGLIPFGLATLRAQVLPRWSRPLPLITSVVLLASGIISLLFNPHRDPFIEMFLATLFGIPWILLGYAVWSQTDLKIGEHEDTP